MKKGLFFTYGPVAQVKGGPEGNSGPVAKVNRPHCTSGAKRKDEIIRRDNGR
jgi:hypothetical protein